MWSPAQPCSGALRPQPSSTADDTTAAVSLLMPCTACKNGGPHSEANVLSTATLKNPTAHSARLLRLQIAAVRRCHAFIGRSVGLPGDVADVIVELFPEIGIGLDSLEGLDVSTATFIHAFVGRSVGFPGHMAGVFGELSAFGVGLDPSNG